MRTLPDTVRCITMVSRSGRTVRCETDYAWDDRAADLAREESIRRVLAAANHLSAELGRRGDPDSVQVGSLVLGRRRRWKAKPPYQVGWILGPGPGMPVLLGDGTLHRAEPATRGNKLGIRTNDPPIVEDAPRLAGPLIRSAWRFGIDLEPHFPPLSTPGLFHEEWFSRTSVAGG